MNDATKPENTPEKKPRALPEPVRMAFEAIAGLEPPDTARDAELRKNLPVLAMKLAQAGQEISPEALRKHALKGPEHIKTLCSRFNRAAEVTPGTLCMRTMRSAMINGARNELSGPKSILWRRLVAQSVAGTPDETEAALNRYFDLISASRAERTQDLHTLLKRSIRAGNRPVTARLLALGALVSYKSSEDPAQLAAGFGDEETLEVLLKKTKRPVGAHRAALQEAARRGQMPIVRRLAADKKTDAETLTTALVKAARHNHLPVIRHLLPLLVRKNAKRAAAKALQSINRRTGPETFDALLEALGPDPIVLQRSLVTAIVCDNAPLVRHLLSNPDRPLQPEENHFMIAVTGKSNDALVALLDLARPADAQLQALLKKAIDDPDDIESAALLLGKGMKPLSAWPETKDDKEHIDNIRRWQEKHGAFPPAGLGDKNPDLFNPDEFEKMREILTFNTDNAKSSADINTTAYQAIAFFQTAERALKYFEKFSHEFMDWLDAQNFELLEYLPEPRNPKIDYRQWGDALLQAGPGMARILQEYGDKLEKPVKAANGKDWSLIATREATAPFRYRHASKHPDLAKFCARNDIGPLPFSSAASLVKRLEKKLAANDNQPKPNSHIPDIRISGDRFDMPGYSFHRLPTGDLRGLFLGEMVDCCQKVCGTAEASVRHGFLSPDGGFYVVRNDISGEIVGETWAWRAKKGEIVFDSLETLGKRVSIDQWRKICREAGKTFAENAQDVTGLCVGADGYTLELLDNKDPKPARPHSRLGYTDARKQYRVWQRSAP